MTNFTLIDPWKHPQLSGGRSTGMSGITATEMIALFGEPNVDDDEYKVDVSWGIEFENGDAVAIWNFKNGPNYNPGAGLTLDDVDSFSIDGTPAAVITLAQFLAMHGHPDVRINGNSY